MRKGKTDNFTFWWERGGEKGKTCTPRASEGGRTSLPWATKKRKKGGGKRDSSLYRRHQRKEDVPGDRHHLHHPEERDLSLRRAKVIQSSSLSKKRREKDHYNPRLSERRHEAERGKRQGSSFLWKRGEEQRRPISM